MGANWVLLEPEAFHPGSSNSLGFFAVSASGSNDVAAIPASLRKSDLTLLTFKRELQTYMSRH